MTGEVSALSASKFPVPPSPDLVLVHQQYDIVDSYREVFSRLERPSRK